MKTPDGAPLISSCAQLFWGLKRCPWQCTGSTRMLRWSNPVKQSNCLTDKVVAADGMNVLVQPSVKVGTMPSDLREFLRTVLLSRRMANSRNKFEVIDQFVMQFRFNGLVIHVAFKSRSLASSKYVGGFCNDSSFLTTRHVFRYACFFLESKAANQYYSKP